MNLQDLPIEVLVKIFDHVSNPVKYTILCKSFYHAISALPSEKRHVKIGYHDMELDSAYLNNLSHYFGQVKINCNKFDEFIMKLGVFIQELTISGELFCQDSTPVDINNILQHTPNCVELEFCAYSTIAAEVLPIEEFKVNLPHLKRLIMPVRSFRHVMFIEKILKQNDLDSLTCNFGTKNEELVSPVLKLLSTTSRNIKEVKLIGTNRIFEHACDLEKLNSLHLQIYFESEEFKGEELEKLKNLKKLQLWFDKDIKKSPYLTSSNLANLEYLEIYCQSENILDFFGDLSSPVLNMKVLIIRCIRIEYPKQLEKILEVFKQLQELKIRQLNEKKAELDFAQLDWNKCYNPNMRILELDFPKKYNYDVIWRALFPNLTSWRVNETKYIQPYKRQRILRDDGFQHFEEFIYKMEEFRELLVKNLKMGPKIDVLRTDDSYQFGKLSIEIFEDKKQFEKFQNILEFVKRQGKKVKELYLKTNITYDTFWQLIASVANCRKMEIDLLSVLDIEEHLSDQSVVEFMSPGKVEEIIFSAHHNWPPHFSHILKNLVKLQPNLKKLTLKSDEICKLTTKLLSFIEIRSLRLISLSIFGIYDPSPEMFIELAALIPSSLKSLTIEITNSSHHPCFILQHFGNLEQLSINMYWKKDIFNMERAYNLEVNPNLKSFSVSTNKVILTVNDIRNILMSCPNLELLYIDFENDLNLELVTLNELYTILEAGQKLRSVYISQIIISDPENIEDCRLKRRFKAFEYILEKKRLSLSA